MQKNGQPLTLALIAAASVIFGMVVAGGLNLTRPGRALEGKDDRPLHAAARAQLSAAAGGEAPPAATGRALLRAEWRLGLPHQRRRLHPDELPRGGGCLKDQSQSEQRSARLPR